MASRDWALIDFFGFKFGLCEALDPVQFRKIFLRGIRNHVGAIRTNPCVVGANLIGTISFEYGCRIHGTLEVPAGSRILEHHSWLYRVSNSKAGPKLEIFSEPEHDVYFVGPLFRFTKAVPKSIRGLKREKGFRSNERMRKAELEHLELTDRMPPPPRSSSYIPEDLRDIVTPSRRIPRRIKR